MLTSPGANMTVPLCIGKSLSTTAAFVGTPPSTLAPGNITVSYDTETSFRLPLYLANSN